MSSVTLLALMTFITLTLAHMSIWHPSMYGVDLHWNQPAGPSASPIGPNLQTMDDWWFRGPGYRALAPAGAIFDLPAGKTVTLEIACNYAFTSYASKVTETVPGSPLDACPGNVGAYHSGDLSLPEPDESLLSGCALAIADVDDIGLVTWDNLVVFSVQHECVKTKLTQFDVPKMMPSCSGEKCICGWFWLANNGTGNFYMTAFDCVVSNTQPDSTSIGPPEDPSFCDSGNSSCSLVSGAKRPLYAYNYPTNVIWEGNYDRPGYHDSWSFHNGAQNGIFLPSTKPIAADSKRPNRSTSSSSKKKLR